MATVNSLDKFADKYLVKSSRLNNWDYSSSGYYFITICTLNHNNFFGKIIDNQMELSNRGEITKQCLIDIPKHFPNVQLDKYVVMPNHIHFLVHVETPDLASLQEKSNVGLIKYSHNNHPNYYFRLNQKSKQLIPKIIQQFKSSVKRECNKQNLFFAWQTRFHDHIIRNQKEYFTIKKYIQNNIKNWEKDELFFKI
jgi:putative transposase